jgi:transcriptional regulator with XRE-family HTH domain
MSEEYYQKIFSSNLKYYMEIYNKSQIDIINDLGFNKSSVSTWYNGTRLPRMDKVDTLAKYFGVNRSDLIEEKEHTLQSDNGIVNKIASLGFSPEEMDEAIDFYDKYKRLSPADQVAIQTLLKSLRPEP